MNRPYPAAEKVNHLRADMPQLDIYRQQLRELVEAAQVKRDLAFLLARSIVERVVNAVLNAEQVEVRRDLLDNIETLGSRDEKVAKRRGGRPPCLPENISSSLHNLRIYGNLVAHPFEAGTTQLKDVTLRASDLDVAVGQLLRVIEWYFEEYAHGPRLPTIYAVPPAPEQTALETAVRLEQQYHLRGFVGRQVELQGVQNWIDGPPRAQGEYLLLLGPPGQGKSALLAELARREQEPARGGCLLHMIKSESSPLRFVPGLLRQSARVAGTSFDPETQRGELPQLRNALSAALQTLRERTGRAVLLIDALDELVADDPQRAYDPRIEFLPPILPPGVRVVLTCRPNIPLVQALEGWLAHLARRDVPPLSAADFRRLLEGRLDEATLRAVVTMLGVDELFARLGGNPLLLSKASERIEELARQASAEKRPLRLTLAELPTTLQAVFRDEYNRIGERAGTRWTSVEGRHKARLLQLLCVAREGLDDRELAGLLAAEGTTLAAEDCRDRLAEMSPYLAELGGGRFKPWHQGLTDHVRREVLGEEGIRRTEEGFCRWMATEHGGRYALRHRVQHLLAAGRAGEAAQLLTTLPELEVRVAAGLVLEMAGDFGAVAAALPEGQGRQRLELLEEALRCDSPFIHRHREDYPQALFQCLRNSCWWYDCPDAKAHYAEGRAPGEGTATGLAELLEKWLGEKERAMPGFFWLRSLRPPAVHLGSAQKMVFRGHEGSVTSVALSPDGRFLASGSSDKTVRVWDAHSGAELYCLRGHEDEVNSVAFSPDGRFLASGSDDKTVRIWDTDSGVERPCLRGHEGEVNNVAFSPDGRFLASVSWDATARLWDAHSGAESRCLHGRTVVDSVALSPDGRLLASGDADHLVRVWDAESGQELRCLHGHGLIVTSVAFSPDGRYLASGSYDKTVRVWDMRSEDEPRCLHGHKDGVTSVAFSPDGELLASGSADQTVRVWHAKTWQKKHCLREHGSAVTSVVFFPNGWLASGSADKTVRVWDVSGNKHFLCLQRPPREVGQLCFSARGRRLVSWSECSVWLWDTVKGTGTPIPLIGWTRTAPWLASIGMILILFGLVPAIFGSGPWILPLLGLGLLASGLFLGMYLGDSRGPRWRTLLVFNIPARPPPAPAWQLQVRDGETVIVADPAAAPIAYFPEPLEGKISAAHPEGCIWAGAVGNYICLVKLEGNPARSSACCATA